MKLRADRALKLLFKGKAERIINSVGIHYFLDAEGQVILEISGEPSKAFNGSWEVIMYDTKEDQVDKLFEELKAKVKKVMKDDLCKG